MNVQTEWFLEMKSTPGKDAMKIVKITKDSEYYKNLVDTVVAGFERTESNFESSTMGKMLPNSIACYQERLCKMRSLLIWQISLVF